MTVNDLRPSNPRIKPGNQGLNRRLFEHQLELEATGTTRLSRNWNIAALVIYCLGAYTAVTIYSSGRALLPCVLSLTAALIFLPLLSPRQLPSLLKALGWPITAAAFLLAVQLFIGRPPDVDSLRATLNLAYSLSLALCAYAMVRRLAPEDREKVFLALAVGVLVLAALEVATPFRIVSEAFRRAVYPQGVLYQSDARDAYFYGGYRPRVFSPEPSYVGVWFSTWLSLWLLSRPVELLSRRSGIFCALTLAMMVILRSPTVGFCFLILACAGAMAPRRDDQRLERRATNPLVLFALILALVLGGFLLNKLSLAFPSSFLGGQSFLARILAPEFIAFRVLTRYPAFGLGIGDQTRLFSEAMSFYLSRRADAASTLYQESSARNIITNSFYLHWIYCGLVGGLIMGASIFRSLVSLRVENTFLVVASGVLMSFTLGGYVTVQVWTVILLFAAVLPRRGEIAST